MTTTTAAMTSSFSSSNSSSRGVGGGGDGGDWLSIPDNRHPLSRDTNPYAYPYFHSSSSSSPCLLYDWVVEFADVSKAVIEEDDDDDDDDNDNEQHHPTSTPTTIRNVTELQRRLVRRIESRCLSHPHELQWKDSCGDTALHRLAQMARLIRTPHDDDNDDDDDVNPYWILRMAKCMICANVDIVTSQNSWKETPLHQFVQHCGLPHQLFQQNDTNNSNTSSSRTNETEERSNTTTTITTRHHPYPFPQHHHYRRNQHHKNPMVVLASLLASRGAASCLNYQKRFPLHDAVELSLVRPPVFLWSQQQEQEQSTDNNNNRNQNQIIIQEYLQTQHVEILKLLVSAAPIALNSLDFHGKSPWRLALETSHTSLSALQVVLPPLDTTYNNNLLIMNQHQRQYQQATAAMTTTTKWKEQNDIFRHQVSLALAECRYETATAATTTKTTTTTTTTTTAEVGNNDTTYYCLAWEKTQFIAHLFSNKLLHGLLLVRAPVRVIELALSRIPSCDLLERDVTTHQRPLELYIRLQQQQQQQQQAFPTGVTSTSTTMDPYFYYHKSIKHGNRLPEMRITWTSTNDILLKLLVQANPSVTSLPCSSYCGGHGEGECDGESLPLHIALQPRQLSSSQLQHQQDVIWRQDHEMEDEQEEDEDMDEVENDKSSLRNYRLPWSWEGSLQILFQAYPMAVGQRDDQTGLYPYQLAATHATKSTKTTTTVPTITHKTTRKNHEIIITKNDNNDPYDGDDDDQQRMITMIYELLRADPSVLR